MQPLNKHADGDTASFDTDGISRCGGPSTSVNIGTTGLEDEQKRPETRSFALIQAPGAGPGSKPGSSLITDQGDDITEEESVRRAVPDWGCSDIRYTCRMSASSTRITQNFGDLWGALVGHEESFPVE